MKYALSLLLIILAHTAAISQDSTLTKTKYIITKSLHDGENLTQFEIDRGGELILEYENQKPVRFINNSAKDSTSSFGPITAFKLDTVSAKEATVLETRSSFKWNFKNDYDSATGEAKITLVQKRSSYGTYFKLIMLIPKTKERIDYWGYKEGANNEAILEETLF